VAGGDPDARAGLPGAPGASCEVALVVGWGCLQQPGQAVHDGRRLRVDAVITQYLIDVG
jgi:hypothetical protein